MSSASDRLMRMATAGAAGWITYQQTCGRSEAFNEHITYLPIFEIASGMKWKVYPQFAIRDEADEKRPRTVDFCFIKEKEAELAVLEVKFVKPDKKYGALFSADIRKMKRLNLSLINDELKQRGEPKIDRNFTIRRYLMIFWTTDTILKLLDRGKEIKAFSKAFKKLIAESIGDKYDLEDDELKAAFLKSTLTRLVGSEDGWLRQGTLRSDNNRFWVATIRCRSIWLSS